MTKFNDPPWHPMTDPVDLKTIGKLSEEVNELGAAIARCIIQGVGEREPATDKPNKDWLEEEIADVYANLSLVMNHFNLDSDKISRRAARKGKQLSEWHKEA